MKMLLSIPPRRKDHKDMRAILGGLLLPPERVLALCKVCSKRESDGLEVSCESLAIGGCYTEATQGEEGSIELYVGYRQLIMSC